MKLKCPYPYCVHKLQEPSAGSEAALPILTLPFQGDVWSRVWLLERACSYHGYS